MDPVTARGADMMKLTRDLQNVAKKPAVAAYML
jgi:hypothetical protein